MKTNHPLVAIGQSGDLALIQHPYVQVYMDVIWFCLIRYVFYPYLIQYAVFFILLGCYVTSHTQHEANDTVTAFNKTADFTFQTFEAPVPAFTEITRAALILISIGCLAFEALQVRITRIDYFKDIGNWLDIVVYSLTLIMTIGGLFGKYSARMHRMLNILFITACARGAVIISQASFLSDDLRLLVANAKKVITK